MKNKNGKHIFHSDILLGNLGLPIKTSRLSCTEVFWLPMVEAKLSYYLDSKRKFLNFSVNDKQLQPS